MPLDDLCDYRLLRWKRKGTRYSETAITMKSFVKRIYEFLKAIFLGLVQALTEYLPVSSSAHVRIVGDLMLGGDPYAAFTAIIQIGTELAVLLYFRHDIWNILKSWRPMPRRQGGKDRASRFGAHNKDARLGWYIIIATIPILIAGVLFQHAIETTLRNLWITVAMLFVFGVILWIVDDRARQVKTLDDMNTKDAIWFGIGQMLALIKAYHAPAAPSPSDEQWGTNARRQCAPHSSWPSPPCSAQAFSKPSRRSKT